MSSASAQPADRFDYHRLLERVQREITSSSVPLIGDIIAIGLGLSGNAQIAKENDKAYQALVDRVIEVVYAIANALQNETPQANFANSVTSLRHTLQEIAGKLNPTGEGLGVHHLKGEQKAAAIRALNQQVTAAVDKFKFETSLNVQLGTQLVQCIVDRIETQVSSSAADVHRLAQEHDARYIEHLQSQSERDKTFALQHLPFAAPAGWDPQKTCLPDTRTAIIQDILTWSTKEDAPPVYWLNGVAGSGKTTIAHTVAEQLNSDASVSCFFFKRDNADCNGPELVITTLVRDLVKQHERLRGSITSALRRDCDLGSKALGIQFTELLLKPIKALGVRHNPRMIVIWDALDECGDASKRRILLSLLKQELPALSSTLRFFITSRPLPDINAYMDAVLTERHYLSLVAEDSTNDLRLYIEKALAEISLDQAPALGTGWLQLETIEQLTKHARGLFIWASTALTLIRNSLDPEEQLERLLSQESVPTAEAALNSLYLLALQQSRQMVGFAEGFQEVMGVIVILQEPLSLLALSHLLRQSIHKAQAVVKHLGAVLHTGAGNTSEPLQIIHPSFADFLTTRTRCITDSDLAFFIDVPKHQAQLANMCLTIMHDLLKEDICQTNCPQLLNVEIEGLDELLEEHVSEALHYACCFWGVHVQAACDITSILPQLFIFYTEDLLH